MEGIWKGNEETDGSYKLYEKLGDQYWLNLKSYPHLRCYDFSFGCIFA